MKEIKKLAAQGDVLFRRVKSLPADAKEQKRDGALVVAHSETGHHHTIEHPDVALLTIADPLVCYLRLDTPFADVVHHRPHDTHETLRLLGNKKSPAYFEVRRQREHTPEGWRRVED